MQLDTILGPNLVNGFCLKDEMCRINPLYNLVKISKFSMLLITYWKSVVARNLSVSRSNLEKHLYSREHPDVSPGLCRRTLQAQAVHCLQSND